MSIIRVSLARSPVNPCDFLSFGGRYDFTSRRVPSPGSPPLVRPRKEDWILSLMEQIFYSNAAHKTSKKVGDVKLEISENLRRDRRYFARRVKR